MGRSWQWQPRFWPNPVGLHTVQVVAVDGLRIRVRNLEAIDGTPVLDVKPVLEPRGER